MKNNEGNGSTASEKLTSFYNQKKHITYTSPDISKMQLVVIDEKTSIYIALDASPDEARNRYLSRMQTKANPGLAIRKPASSAT